MARKSKWLIVSKQFFFKETNPNIKLKPINFHTQWRCFRISPVFSPQENENKKQIKEKPIFLKNSLYNSCLNQTKYSKQSKTNKQTNQVTRQLQTM